VQIPARNTVLRLPTAILTRARTVTGDLLEKLAGVLPELLDTRRRASVLQTMFEKMITTVPIGNEKILMYTPFPILIWRAQSLFSKEADTIAWIDEFDEGSVFWDIGANVGVYSLYAAVKRHANVLSFEPAAGNFYVLTQNIHLNGLDGRVATYCIALSNITELGMINLSSVMIGSAVHQFGKAGERSPYAERGIPLAMHGALGFSVDRFIEQFAPSFPNYIKIDVDGRELAILTGASRTLSDVRLKSVMVELSDTYREIDRAVKVLEQAGLKLVSRGETQRAAGNYATNYLFRRI
jgi:FkbM family methyltransferase